MLTPLWTTHESPIQQLLSATLYLEKHRNTKTTSVLQIILHHV